MEFDVNVIFEKVWAVLVKLLEKFLPAEVYDRLAAIPAPIDAE